MRLALAAHALLILLASTNFTLVTSLTRGERFQWNYYQYSSESGFGYPFLSDFSLPVVMTYLAAFAFGVVGFSLAIRSGRHLVGPLGVALSAIGLFSFALEASHWVLDHHHSWIAFSSAIMLILAFAAALPMRSSPSTEQARVP